jgi:hypothetical protein
VKRAEGFASGARAGAATARSCSKSGQTMAFGSRARAPYLREAPLGHVPPHPRIYNSVGVSKALGPSSLPSPGVNHRSIWSLPLSLNGCIGTRLRLACCGNDKQIGIRPSAFEMSDSRLADAFAALREVTRRLEAEGRTPRGANVKPLLTEELGHAFKEDSLGFRSFKEFVLAAENAGYVEVDMTRPRTDFVLRSGGGVFRLLAEVVMHIEARGQRPIAAAVKRLLVDSTSGQFKESDYGFETFRDFVHEAEARGLIAIDHEASGSDYVLWTTMSRTSSDGPERLGTSRRTTPAEHHLDTSAATSLDEAYELLRQVSQDAVDEGRVPDISGLKYRMKKRSSGGNFTEKKLGFEKFGEFVYSAEAAGYVTVQNRRGGRGTGIDVYPISSSPIDFSDIRFGYTSASAESVRQPRLLLEGFYDPHRLADRLAGGDDFLVLGHKGSGKSALGEHLWLQANERSESFVDFIDLRDFPYGSLEAISNAEASPSLLQLGWAWLLLVRSFQSLMNDQAATAADPGYVSQLRRALEKEGLLPSRNIRDLSLRSADVSIRGQLPLLLEGAVAATIEAKRLALSEATDRMRQAVENFRTPHRHIVIIDGLDELLRPDGTTYQSLSALLSEVESINDSFARNRSAVKYIVLCRSDLYERLPNPNKNQLRRDYAISLRWFDEETDHSDLFGLILHRARLSGYDGDDPVADFFPRVIRSTGGRSIEVRKLLFECTRYTPRDLVALLSIIQESASGPTISANDVKRGLARYSSEYLVPELKDELAGYFAPDDVDQILGLLVALTNRTFTWREFVELATRRGLRDLDLRDVIGTLYECSAIGQERSTSISRDHRFRYHDPYAAIDIDLPFIIHRGAWQALSKGNIFDDAPDDEMGPVKRGGRIRRRIRSGSEGGPDAR